MHAYLIRDMEQSSFPARVPLVTEPMTLLQSLAAARRNVLSIIPDIATRQPMVSGDARAHRAVGIHGRSFQCPLAA